MQYDSVLKMLKQQYHLRDAFGVFTIFDNYYIFNSSNKLSMNDFKHFCIYVPLFISLVHCQPLAGPSVLNK